MDVRCDKCGTEYELDDTKLKPSGVTVRCTECGHTFKVRKRASTALGVAPDEPPRPANKRASTQVRGSKSPTRDPRESPEQPERRIAVPREPASTRDSGQAPMSAGAVPASASRVDSGRLSVPKPNAIPQSPASQADSGRVMRSKPSSSSPFPQEEAGRTDSGPLSAGNKPASKERRWIVRMADGTTEVVRELSTLQQWIVSGRVTRDCGISRNGKTWKNLGDIRELYSFFEIADEANETLKFQRDDENDVPPRSSRMPPGLADSNEETARLPASAGPRPVAATLAAPAAPPPAKGSERAQPPLPAPSSSTSFAAAGAGEAVRGVPSQPTSPPVRAPSPLPSASPALSSSSGSLRSAPSASPPPGASSSSSGSSMRLGESPAASTSTLPPAAPAVPRVANPTGPAMGREGKGLAGIADEGLGATSWGGEVRKSDLGQQGGIGPTGGLARGIPTHDVAFAGSKIGPLTDSKTGSFAKYDRGKAIRMETVGDDESERSGAGKWIALGSLLVMAGAAAAVYLLVFREPKADVEQPVALLMPDAGVVAELGEPTGVVVSPPDAGTGIISVAENALASDHRPALEEALKALAGGDSGAAADPVLMVAKARLHTALAQQLADEASLLDKRDAKGKELRKSTDTHLLEALTLVKKALQVDRNDPDANVAMADILRLQNKPGHQVESYLESALARDPESRDALYVRALMSLREGQESKAREILTKLAQGTTTITTRGRGAGQDLRPLYRLALLDFAAKSYPDAKARVDKMLAASADHSGATALALRIADAIKVDTSDPLPPEEGSLPGGGQGQEPGSDTAGQGDLGYDELLARANRKAESGDCRGAMALYERALEADPTGIAALTGMGYCHLDSRDFAKAEGKFRAALGVSPRYQDALWGLAEMYQQQGKTDKAIEAYQRFVDEHPTATRAASARKQIERLGGGGQQGGGSQPEPPSPDPSGGQQGTEQPSGGSGNPPPEPAPSPAPGGDQGGTAEPQGDTPTPGPT